MQFAGCAMGILPSDVYATPHRICISTDHEHASDCPPSRPIDCNARCGHRLTSLVRAEENALVPVRLGME